MLSRDIETNAGFYKCKFQCQIWKIHLINSRLDTEEKTTSSTEDSRFPDGKALSIAGESDDAGSSGGFTNGLDRKGH